MNKLSATTDERLKSFLNSNQLYRERMCAALLAIDRRFSGIKQRHPHGGPDGGIDIEAMFEDSKLAYIAAGFINEACDSSPQKTKIRKKFRSDFSSVISKTPAPAVFVFFTNINFTVAEKGKLHSECTSKGVSRIEIFDRERMKIMLDSPDGLGIRYQYLQLPLSDAEQAAFFSRWGDDIQRVIADGFGKVEQALQRIQFLYEANSPLDSCVITVELDEEYPAVEVGHFRLVASLYLQEDKHGIFGISFGVTDDPNRSNATSVTDLIPARGGIGQGICGKQWKLIVPDEIGDDDADSENEEIALEEDARHVAISGFTAVGREKVKFLSVSFGFGNGFFRRTPYLLLRDLEDCNFALFANESLARRIKAIHVNANEYKIAEFQKNSILLDQPHALPYFPLPFSELELSDKWTRIMCGMGPFRVLFSEKTPVRLYEAERVVDSLWEMHQKQYRTWREAQKD